MCNVGHAEALFCGGCTWRGCSHHPALVVFHQLCELMQYVHLNLFGKWGQLGHALWVLKTDSLQKRCQANCTQEVVQWFACGHLRQMFVCADM